MPTLKETLEKLNLEIDIPKVQYEYPMLAYYESYEYKTVDGEKCLELKRFMDNDMPLICVVHLEIKKNNGIFC